MKSKIAIVFFAALALMFVSNCMQPMALIICNVPLKIGPYSGIVLDSQTRQPIKGAKVYVIAGGEKFTLDSMFYPFELGDKWKEYLTETDEQGRYKVPALFMTSCPGGYRYCESGSYRCPDLIIYKSGYVGYRNDRIFVGGPYERCTKKRSDFKEKDNVVLLEKWDDKKFTWERDHSNHLDFIDCGSVPNRKFCWVARDEMVLICMGEENSSRKRFGWDAYTIAQCEQSVDKFLSR